MPVTWKAEQIVELAVSAIKKGYFDRAADLCVGALRIDPGHPEAWHIRGIASMKLGRHFDAILHFDRALDINPNMYDCWNNRGIALAEVGMWEMAQQSFTESLKLNRTPEPHIMLAGMYAHLMKLEKSEEHFRKALDIEPQNQDAHLKLGVILLARGKWREAWREYEWRWFDTPHLPRPWRLYPKWQGEDLTGKQIVLYSEQGYGDEIMALRFVLPFMKKCMVVLEVRPTMLRLAKCLQSDWCHVQAVGDRYPGGIDYSCPLLDTPMHLGMMPKDLDGSAYLLPVDCDHDFRNRMASAKGLKVGLCWSAGRRALQPETEASAKAKSIPLANFEPITQVSGCTFFSLKAPVEHIPKSFGITDWMPEVDDFADTADLISHLDLVISVDTSIAHLAGALGVPVWNLVRFNGYWPWMLETPGSGFAAPTPWYRSMKVYQQHTLGEWETIIARVAQDLAALIEKRQAA